MTLARRGHKSALPRALEVFRELPKDRTDLRLTMAGVPRRNLQSRVLVLLSNSAKAARVPQPSPPQDEGQQLDYLVRWWREHGDRVALEDPWMKILEKQKVD